MLILVCRLVPGLHCDHPPRHPLVRRVLWHVSRCLGWAVVGIIAGNSFPHCTCPYAFYLGITLPLPLTLGYPPTGTITCVSAWKGSVSIQKMPLP